MELVNAKMELFRLIKMKFAQNATGNANIAHLIQILALNAMKHWERARIAIAQILTLNQLMLSSLHAENAHLNALHAKIQKEIVQHVEEIEPLVQEMPME